MSKKSKAKKAFRKPKAKDAGKNVINVKVQSAAPKADRPTIVAPAPPAPNYSQDYYNLARAYKALSIPQLHRSGPELNDAPINPKEKFPGMRRSETVTSSAEHKVFNTPAVNLNKFDLGSNRLPDPPIKTNQTNQTTAQPKYTLYSNPNTKRENEIEASDDERDNQAPVKNFLKASYGNEDAIQALTEKGFIFDKEISSPNNKVFYNTKENKLVMATAGTHSFSDAITDLEMGVFGYNTPLGLKNNSRYKESKKTFSLAKNKYSDSSAVIVGHSLGGTIASQLARENKGTKAITYNRFFHPLYEGKPSKDEIVIANQGDLLYKMHRYKANYTIPSDSYDPLKNHALKELDKNFSVESLTS